MIIDMNSKIYYIERYCKDYVLIENYDLALADDFKGWHCHHRLETHTLDGKRLEKDIPMKELKEKGIYYDRPPEELIFMKSKDHKQLHMKEYDNYAEHREQYLNKYNETHKEQIKQYRKQHYEKNKEYIKQQTKEYRDSHKEQKKQYREANKEHIKQQRKQHYDENKELIKQQSKQYREANKELVKQKDKERKNRPCLYNGETLTLCALARRFRKEGIEHPTLEAKKYLIQ